MPVFEQTIEEVASALEQILFGIEDASWALRGELDPSMSQLLIADVLLVNDIEVWYEIEMERRLNDSDPLAFRLRVTTSLPLPPQAKLAVRFGSHKQVIVLDSDGNARWSLPAETVIDARTRRVIRPIRIGVCY